LPWPRPAANHATNSAKTGVAVTAHWRLPQTYSARTRKRVERRPQFRYQRQSDQERMLAFFVL
jgi:hypothetical protein